MRILTFGFLTVLAVGAAASSPPPPPAGSLTIETLLEIRHPSRGAWSSEGSRIAWVWDRGGVQNVFVTEIGPGRATPPRSLTAYDSGLIDALFWGRGEVIYFARGGDLWQVTPDGKTPPRPVWTTSQPEGGVVLSPDGARVAFLRAEDIWVRQLSDGRETRLTQSPGARAGLTWSPDGSHLAFTVISATRRDEALDYVGAKVLFSRIERSTSDVAVVPAAGGETTVLASGPGAEGAPRWIDAARLSFQRVSEDLKSREVLAVPRSGGDPRLLHRDLDAKWWSLTYLNPDPIPSPDGRFVAFISDRDGWDHLYVVPSGGGAVSQITRGRFEVTSLAWSPDSRTIAFDTNEGNHPGSRQIAVAQIGESPAAAKVITLTSGRGTHTQPNWSPEGRRLLYQHTDPQSSADLFVIDSEPGASPKSPTRLTDSFPPGVDRSQLVEPKLVRYPAPDGQSVPAYLFTHRGLDLAQKHPAIVWIHGDGVTQNYDGWHLRRDYAVYYSFHQYLAQRGYVVLAVDYRGSIGYGRDWRQGHFRDLGGSDYQDVAAGVDYLKTLGYVDAERVGVWGLSYGGFMTLQALTVTPRLFRCGIDVAGVVDWRDWHADPDGPWIKGRMGSPAENSELYQRTAPIERVDRIERPLMVLHGTADVNVPFLESVRLLDVATRRGKNVEFMMYPGEFHYFHRAHVIRDAWSRVERFFDAHLRAERVSSSGGR